MTIKDRALARLARQSKDLHEQEKELEKQRKAINDRIVAELKERGTELIETDGIRITRVAQYTTTFDLAKLRRVLRNRPDVLERCLKTVPDRESIESELEAGNISGVQLKRFTTKTPKAEYPFITEL